MCPPSILTNGEVCSQMEPDATEQGRRSIRLKGFDYSQQGAYFVTICAWRRLPVFGQIVGDEMRANDLGRMAEQWWAKLPSRFSGVEVDEHVIMPNHFHGVILVTTSPGLADVATERNGRPHGAAPTLGAIVRWFKTMTTNEYLRGLREGRWRSLLRRLWQRNYYERIVRDEDELNAIREYIVQNSARWARDVENPLAKRRAAPRIHWDGL